MSTQTRDQRAARRALERERAEAAAETARLLVETAVIDDNAPTEHTEPSSFDISEGDEGESGSDIEEEYQRLEAERFDTDDPQGGTEQENLNARTRPAQSVLQVDVAQPVTSTIQQNRANDCPHS